MSLVNRIFGLAAVLVIVVLSAGCSESKRDAAPEPGAALPSATASASAVSTAPASPPKGVSHATLTHAGLERTYRLFIPSSVTPTTKTPLVLALHGGLGWGDQFAANSNFEALAEREGFIVAFPDGADRTWNGGNCCGQSVRKNTDDVGFLAALIAHLTATLPVDPERVFMTGHSNGGIMSFRFACERPDLVRAIAPVAGSLEVPKCSPSSGVSLLAIHGDADQNHPLEGGEGERSIAGVAFVSMEKSLELWTAGMRCESDPERSTAGAITSTTWTKCRDRAVATFLVIAGADHPWPGGTGGARLEGRVSDALDATTAVWTFFSALR